MTRRYDKLQEFKTLEDVSILPYIDKGVKNLVRALQSIRVPTNASCEGHLNSRHHYHPWVGFNPFSFAKIKALEYLVDKYNKGHDIKWEVEGSWLKPNNSKEICPSCNYPERKMKKDKKKLAELQKSADELSRYIFNNREDKKIRELILAYGF